MATPLKVNQDGRMKRIIRLSEANKSDWFLPWSFVAVIIACFWVEWYASPIEKALGAYMTWTRIVRPEVGQGWELNRVGEEADRRLGELTEQIERRNAASASLRNWSEVPRLLERYTAFSISPDRFLDLYADLPEVMQRRIFSPIELLRLKTSGRWQRVYFLDENGSPYIYLVDPYNVVLAQSHLMEHFFLLWNSSSEIQEGYLEEDLAYAGRTFQPEEFFQSVEPVGQVSLYGMEMDWLADLSGQLVQIGIAKDSYENIGIIGLELERSGQHFIQQVLVPDSLARNLYSELLDRTLFESVESIEGKK